MGYDPGRRFVARREPALLRAGEFIRQQPLAQALDAMIARLRAILRLRLATAARLAAVALVRSP